MALPYYAAITTQEFKDYLGLSGTAQDSMIETFITEATDEFENLLDRFLVFRSAAEAVSALVNAQSWTNGAITVANQPNSAGRTVIVTWTTATAGVLTITGTVAGVAGVTETFDVANGTTQRGVKFFTAISAASAANAAGAGTVTVNASTGFVEYHTMRANGRDLAVDELRPREWPIISIGELCEDLNWPRTYPTSSRLVVDADYQLVKGNPRDFLRRLSAGSVAVGWYWPTGLKADNLSYGPAPRPIRLTYAAGYANTAAVPTRIKAQIKRYVAVLFSERTRGAFGVSSQSDALGNFQRFGPAKITDDMIDALRDDMRIEQYETGEAA